MDAVEDFKKSAGEPFKKGRDWVIHKHLAGSLGVDLDSIVRKDDDSSMSVVINDE